ncbi:diphthamide synthesis protein [Candidatus Pacearchaeota archaeon]|nr:diphthamide synthesis protein [Candidatus Pacearchaeota archaeon]
MTQLIFIDSKYEGEIELSKKALDYLKNLKVENKRINSVALFASVQFTKIGKILDQLKSVDIEYRITKAKRTSAPLQILGCDCYNDSFKDNIVQESDAVLYIGDGLFHPKALLLAQLKSKNIKPIIIWDPMLQKLSILDKKDIQQQVNKTKANIKRYINARKIGILVTIKPGQQYLNSALRLKSLIESETQGHGKKAFIFIDDTLDIRALENYPFIEAWVNTACPRIGTDDITTIRQPMINLREAFNPIKALEEMD